MLLGRMNMDYVGINGNHAKKGLSSKRYFFIMKRS